MPQLRESVEPLYRAIDTDPHAGNLASAVVTELEAEILRRGWPVGTVIATETELLERFGVSSPVLRRAVGILEREQIARMRRGPGGGLLVMAPDESSVGHAVTMFLEYLRVDPDLVSEARTSIEIACVELAGQRIRESDVPALRALVAAEPNVPNPENRFCLVDIHIAIAELSGNPVLALFVKMLHTLLAQRNPSIPDPLDEDLAASYQRVHQEHRDIVEALAGGDASLARLRMIRHLDQATSLARELRDRRDPNPRGHGARIEP
jgi:DNA-binding FadR family transcriptional regulator